MTSKWIEPNASTPDQSEADLEITPHVDTEVVGVRAHHLQFFENQRSEIERLWASEHANNYDAAAPARNVHCQFGCRRVASHRFDDAVHAFAVSHPQDFGAGIIVDRDDTIQDTTYPDHATSADRVAFRAEAPLPATYDAGADVTPGAPGV